MVYLEHFFFHDYDYDSLKFIDYIKIFIDINCALMTELICSLGKIIYMFLIYPMSKLKYQVAGKL